jgi:uncharacterized repeat protein (TIGR01451 family)
VKIMRIGRRGRYVVLATAGLLVGVGVVVAAQPSGAVHDTGMFELDGNIVHNAGSTPPYDWASLFDAAGHQVVTPDPVNGPLLASTFIADATTPDATYFTQNGAGVKDIQPIANWGCKTQNNPTPKDDLQNAYAALVQIPDTAPDNAGDQVLYLGSERGSNNGDSFAGFWLLKDNTVGCSGSDGFSGHHTDGDLLVVSNYTNGGGTQDVQVYRWTGDDATGSPVLQTSGGICGSTAPDDACAIANAGTITSPWSPTSHDSNTFVEAGIDLTTLLGNSGGCFTTFLAETRSSQQLTATLKDYAAGQFNTCVPPEMTTTATPGGSQVAPGSAQHDVATLSAVGGRPVPTGTVAFFLCSPSQVTAAGCPSGAGDQIGSAVTLTNGSATSDTVSGADDTALGKYCWRAEYTPDQAASGFYVPTSHTNADTECFTVVHATPTISTQIAVTGDNAPGLGFTTLGDTATLHGALGNTDGETITFKLYGPYGNGVTPTCTGDPVFTTTGTLSGGSATTSQTFTPIAAGTYVWVASYPGDPLNDAVTGKCTDVNESVTIVGATVDVSKSANPPGPVSAGDNIGFDITVTNSGSVPAAGVTVTDNLPGGADLNWALDPPFNGCSITGAQGSQVLSCDLGTVEAGDSVGPIHVTSPTKPADCGEVSNKASVTTTNGTGGDSDVATVTVNCPNVTLTKTADADSVPAGDPIGFTVTASNAGPGTAHDVTISDSLPPGDGISWSIESQSPSGSCTISSGTLNCNVASLAAGAKVTVHVTSPTTAASCKAYDNTASATIGNQAKQPEDAKATTTVQCSGLTLTKTADADSVPAGSAIGFTITASNAGPATATGVTITDALPAGDGIDWKLDASAPANCTITGTPPNQTLSCSAVDLAAGDEESVHVTSATTDKSCAIYENTAKLDATNAPSLTAHATTRVECVTPTPTPTPSTPSRPATSPPPTSPPLAGTGAGPIRDELIGAAGLIILGGLALLFARRSRRRHS